MFSLVDSVLKGMAQKSIREYDGKRMLFDSWKANPPAFCDDKINLVVACLCVLKLFTLFQVAQVAMKDKSKPFNFSVVAAKHPWLTTTTLVVKPDQLVKRRGELGWEESVVVLA